MNFTSRPAPEHSLINNRLKVETQSPPHINLPPEMCPTTSTTGMPLPPPLTFNSTKIKSKQSARVSPVNGAPSVTPFTSVGQSVQSCQVQPQQRTNRVAAPGAPVVCKHSTEMLNKLNTISKDLIALAELVKDIQKQQFQLNHQLSETKEQVAQNTNLIKSVTEQFKVQMSTLVNGQLEQTEFITTHDTKLEEKLRVCMDEVNVCHKRYTDLMKQNEGFKDILEVIKGAVMQTAQNTTAAMEAASGSSSSSSGGGVSGSSHLQNNVPHLTHDPIPETSTIPSESPQNLSSVASATQLQQPNSTPMQVQLNQGYSGTPTLQHMGKVSSSPVQPMQIQLGDNNKYYCIGANGVQQSIQMFSVPPQLLQGIQAIQNIQGANNLVQLVAPPSASSQIKPKSNRPQEIRPKQTALTPKKSDNNSSCAGLTVNSSPKTTNILEEASKVLSNPSMEADSDSSYSTLYNQSNPEKDALAEAIMTIPTTFSQQHVTSSSGNNNTSSFSDSMDDHPSVGDGSIAMQVTSEMLSKAINVVEGDHNLYFDKVLIGPNGENQGQQQQQQHQKDIHIPSFLPDEVINCVFRKSKEPSIYALNICREIISREEFINNDFKSFVSKNPLKYKFIEHLLTTKFGLYSEHLQSILKDVRIKFNNYHRHVKRSVRLKEMAKQEQLQLEIERLEQEQRSSDEHEKMLELLKQEPASIDRDSFT